MVFGKKFLGGVSVIAITIVAIIIAIILGAAGGYMARKRTAEAQIGSAEEEARRIVDEAREKSNAEKKEAILEAKEELPFFPANPISYPGSLPFARRAVPA